MSSTSSINNLGSPATGASLEPKNLGIDPLPNKVTTATSEQKPGDASPMSSAQETPKIPEAAQEAPKARGLKGAILALIAKIKNFFSRAPKQTAEQNNAEATKFQGQIAELLVQIKKLEEENAQLKSNSPVPDSKETSPDSAEDASTLEALSTELDTVKGQLQRAESEKQGLEEAIAQLKSNSPAPTSQDAAISPEEMANLRQQLKENQQQLAELQQQLAEKPVIGALTAEALIQKLDTPPSTPAISDLCALLRNEIPSQGFSGEVQMQALASNGVPPPPPPPPAPGVPPPPPPPPAPNGIAGGSPSSGGITKGLNKKPATASGPNFLDVVSKCRNFFENGYNMDGVVVHDAKGFTERMRELKVKIEDRRQNNDKKLEGIKRFHEQIAKQRDDVLLSLEKSPNISAEQLSALKDRYALNVELFLKDADQLKALGFMSESQHAKLSQTLEGMSSKKDDLIKSLETYLSERKSIEQYEREINGFKLPLPDTKKTPYINLIFKLLELEKNCPNDAQGIKDILATDYGQQIQTESTKNEEKRIELEQKRQDKKEKLDAEKDKVRGIDCFKPAIEVYDNGDISDLLRLLMTNDEAKKNAKELNINTQTIKKLNDPIASIDTQIKNLHVSEETLIRRDIRQKLKGEALEAWKTMEKRAIAVEDEKRRADMAMAGKS